MLYLSLFFILSPIRPLSLALSHTHFFDCSSAIKFKKTKIHNRHQQKETNLAQLIKIKSKKTKKIKFKTKEK